jgi:hypothetical protein
VHPLHDLVPKPAWERTAQAQDRLRQGVVSDRSPSPSRLEDLMFGDGAAFCFQQDPQQRKVRWPQGNQPRRSLQAAFRIEYVVGETVDQRRALRAEFMNRS